jgi:DNA-binding CsgD family transcriptional regulator
MNSDKADQVRDLLYEAASVASEWPKALAKLAEATESESAHFALWNKTERRADFAVTARADPSSERRYAVHYGAIDPVRRVLDGEPSGRWIASNMVFDESFVRRSEYYNEFLAPLGYRHVAKSRVFEAPDHSVYGVVGLARSPEAEPFSAAELAEIAATFNGDLRRVAGIHYRLAPARVQGRLLEAALDRLAFGVLVLNQDRRVLALNRRAQTILDDAQSLRVRDGLLAACRPEDDRRLASLFSGGVTTGHVRVPPTGGEALTLTISPLCEAVDLPCMQGDPGALVVISEARSDTAAATIASLGELFGLTSAEAQLALLIGSGVSVQSAAQQLHKMEATARAQLKSIFAKTGVSRQSELAALVTRLSQSPLAR